MIGLELTREGMTQYVAGRTQGYRMKISTTRVEGLESEVFVWQVLSSGDRFTNIASPGDLDLYPTEENKTEADLFYRTAVADVDWPNIDEANEAWEVMKTHAKELVDTLKKMEVLEVQEVYVAGEFSSSSSSSSDGA